MLLYYLKPCSHTKEFFKFIDGDAYDVEITDYH